MNTKTTIIGGILTAVLLAPGMASASFVLDTGVPTGGSTYVLSAAQWVAGEFSVTAGTDITDLSAYLTQGAGSVGDTFTFDIYSTATSFTGRATGRTSVFTATGTFTQNGWNTTAVDWTPTTTGDYWLALQVGPTNSTKGLDLPGETSASTGTAPALGFAYLGSGTSSEYTTVGAPSVGLEVTAGSPVPLPPALWLLGSGILGLGSMARRRRAGSGPTVLARVG
jgi:hypothetical protein